MSQVDLQAFEYIVGKVTDGFLFEKFAQDLLCQIIGIGFVPLGGVKDRGIDGLDHTWSQKSDPKTIYQISIQATPRAKILATAKTLSQNQIPVQRLFYVTNREVPDQDKLIEEIYTKHKIQLTCKDIAWLRGNVAQSESTIRIYSDFVANNAHQYSAAPPNLIVQDFVKDPRIFVFLRQQFELRDEGENLRDLLVDSLLLYGLEGTDPDKGIFRTQSEIIHEVTNAVKFPVKQIEGLARERLTQLSTKPRRINYHPGGDKYCLPYETRLELHQKRIRDASLFEEFQRSTRSRLAKHLKLQNVRVRGADLVLDQVFNQLFKKQGLDFSNFILNEEDTGGVESAVTDIIETALETAAVSQQNRNQARQALQGTIREIIYQGGKVEREYLQKLSRTYMLLFLVQCEPKVCSYFDTLAAKLKVFVCNSILVPALSEIALPVENRRHWNLLTQANKAGVRLFVSHGNVDELVGHIQRTIRTYGEEYDGLESQYSDDRTLRYVPIMLIRAHLYERAKGSGETFQQFINKFVTPGASTRHMAQELTLFLKEEFGIQSISDQALGVQVASSKLKALSAELQKHKKTSIQATNDAKTILTILALREKNNEFGDGGIFGLKSWWLSKDTWTHRAVTKCFKPDKPVSCYLRPDFLLNYIALSDRANTASKVFDEMFPTLIGVSLSHHVTDDMSKAVHDVIKSHKGLSTSRLKAAIATSTTRLMTDGAPKKQRQLRHILEEAVAASG